MGPFAMPTAEKALQSGQTRPIPCWRIAAANLLTQEIQADFCHHPFAQGAVESILPPAALHALGCQRTFPCCPASVHCIASRIARRMAVLSSSCKAHPNKSAVTVGRAVAAVVQRRLCCCNSCFMRFCAQLDVPTRLIQAQHLLRTPVRDFAGW
jgi:hypothetical protein